MGETRISYYEDIPEAWAERIAKTPSPDPSFHACTFRTSSMPPNTVCRDLSTVSPPDAKISRSSSAE